VADWAVGFSEERGAERVLAPPLTFDFAGGSWDLSRGARVVGILNVTPDSFFDGGRYASPEHAIARAETMAALGADAVDVGGQSTRPGAKAPLGAEAEWERLRTVLPELARRLPIPVSIDTYHAEVARRALEHGAAMVNDVTGLAHDPAMLDVVARSRAGLVIMHSIGGPAGLHEARTYGDLGAELLAFFEARIAIAAARGIPRERIAIDPGIGFSKRAEQSLEALRALPRLAALGRPLWVGASRKSFLTSLANRSVDERLGASLGAAVAAFALGARIIRAHDVQETRDALRVAEAILARSSATPRTVPIPS